MSELPIYARYKVYDSAESKWKLYYFETNTRQVLRVDKSDTANYPTSDQFVTGEILKALNGENASYNYLKLAGGALNLGSNPKITATGVLEFTSSYSVYLLGATRIPSLNAKDISIINTSINIKNSSGTVIATFDNSGLTLSNGKKISVNYTPSVSTDVVNKQYVDMVAGYGMNPIEAVKVATTKNITLSGTTGEGSNKIDGIFIQVGDRVLVKNQTNAKDNGVYIVASGAWERAEDAETPAQLTGGLVGVNHGNENKRCLFYQRSTVSTVGTSNQEWILFMNAADYYTALDGLYVTGNAFGINPGGVTEAKIATNAVTTTKIKDKNVTTDKIADKGVTTEKLADSAITTVKILDGNVTHAKLGNFAVTPSALPTSAVTGATLQTILGYYATQFKNVVGETNWYKAPVTSIKSLSNTLAGAQSQITGLLTSVADITTNLNGKQNTIAIGSTAPTSPADKNIWLDTAA